MHTLRCIDNLLIPAIEKTFAGTQTAAAALRNSPLEKTQALRDDANNAAVAAWEAKTIFERDLKSSAVPDKDAPEHTMLVVDSEQKLRALRLVYRHLKQAFTLTNRVTKALYEREYAQDPELRPPSMTLKEVTEAIEEKIQYERHSTPEQQREYEAVQAEADERYAAMSAAQAEMPEQRVIDTISNTNFKGFVADAIGMMGALLDEIDTKNKSASKGL